RSVAHTGGGHPSGTLQLLSGDPDPQDKLKPLYPDFMSVANRLRFDPRRPLPNYVGVNPVVRYDGFTIAGPAYLGEPDGPCAVMGDPNAPTFRVPNIGLADPREAKQVTERAALFKVLDTLRRNLDQSRAVESMDRFHAQALHLLTSSKAAQAFDLNLES